MKKILLVLCLLLLVSCGTRNDVVDTPEKEDTPTTPTVEEPEQGSDTPTVSKKEEEKTPETEIPQNKPQERTPEEQLVDKNLTMMLREQLAGAYDVKGATFTFTTVEELEGKECFAYEMQKGENSEIFAVATDCSAIFHLEGKDFVKIFGIE